MSAAGPTRDTVIAVAQARTAAHRVALATLMQLLGCAGGPRPAPPPQVASSRQPPAPAPATEVATLRDDVVVTGGVHGNEPSGAAALPELQAAGLRTFGPCNPWGLERGSRYLADGRDLNRSFAIDGIPEVDAVKAFLAAHPPALLLDLHEDGTSSGAFLIQHGPNDDLGRRIIDALKNEIVFDPAPKFMPIEGKDGLLQPSSLALGVVAMSGTYGLAFDAWQTYGVTTFVVEVPRGWPAERKRATHIRIVKTARQLFSLGTKARARRQNGAM